MIEKICFLILGINTEVMGKKELLSLTERFDLMAKKKKVQKVSTSTSGT